MCIRESTKSKNRWIILGGLYPYYCVYTLDSTTESSSSANSDTILYLDEQNISQYLCRYIYDLGQLQWT